MRTNSPFHQNNCSRCPALGAQTAPGDEFCEILSLRFNIQIARELCHGHVPHLVNRRSLEQWLEHGRIDWEHVDHLPISLGPGVMATLPNGCGMPVIDGNHRAARALRNRHEFLAFVLDESETLELLRRSMSIPLADHYWERLLRSKPHPNVVHKGELR